MNIDMLVVLMQAPSNEGSILPEWVREWLDVHHIWELWWLLLGLIAQLLFGLRWVVQWLVSERRRESHVPEFFWWASLVGATLLLVYFIGRREPIGTLGQLTGWIVYIRNLHLIKTKQRSIIDDVPMEHETDEDDS